MGYWGYFPCDGDGAWDFFGRVCDKANEYIKELFKKRIGQCRWRASFLFDRAGLIVLLLQRGFHIKLPLVEKAIEYLDVALKDKKWNRMASDPNEAIKQILLVRKAMKDLIQAELKRKLPKVFIKQMIKSGWRVGKPQRIKREDVKITAPRGWLQREWEKAGSSWTGCTEIHRLQEKKRGANNEN